MGLNQSKTLPRERKPPTASASTTSVAYGGRLRLVSPPKQARKITRPRRDRSVDSLRRDLPASSSFPGNNFLQDDLALLPSTKKQQRRRQRQQQEEELPRILLIPLSPKQQHQPTTESSPLLNGRGLLLSNVDDVSSMLAVVPANNNKSSSSELYDNFSNSNSSFFSSGSMMMVIPPAWWLLPALICATCYALYNIFIKLGSASIHPILGGVILQFVAAILGSFMLLLIMWRDGGADDLHYDADGIKWAVCAGVAVGAAEILSFTVSGLGVPATQSIPIVIGGSVGIGCILGLVLLHETLGRQGWIGVAMIILGVGLVGTDPSGADPMN
jgi:bacterial/archaeal transporter family protein